VLASENRQAKTLDGADHLLTRDQDSKYAARMLAAWASKYIGGEGQVMTGVLPG